MNQDLIGRLLSNILALNVLYIQDLKKDCLQLEKLYCFHPDLQPLYTAEGFETVLSRTEPGIFYIIEDILHVSCLFFQFQGTVYVAGPYAASGLDEKEVSSVLSGMHLTHSHLQGIKVYFSEFLLYERPTLIRLCQGVLSSFEPGSPEFTVRDLYGFHGEEARESYFTRQRQRYESIYKNYARENRMMKMIQEGRTDDALQAFMELIDPGIVQDLQANETLYHDAYVGDAILRTLIRKAAEAGGLSVVTIHRLTQEHVQRSFSVHGHREFNQNMYDLVREITEEVRLNKLKVQGYSRETRNVLEYLSLHFTEEVRMDDLVKALNYSKAHISALFRNDTGLTIMQYMARMRCEKAAELLVNTEISIQNISMLVGYEDSNYFVKVFRREMGDTPSGYRKKHT